MKTGIGLVFGAIIVVIVHLWTGGSAGDLIQPASLSFVLLGTFLSTFLSAPKGEFGRAFRTADEGNFSTEDLKKELVSHHRLL